MRIIQILPCLDYGDAVGNDTLAIDGILKKMGYDTVIYTEAVDPRIPAGLTKTMEQWEPLSSEDVLIYHMAIGWRFIGYIKDAPCRKIAIYHNVTPAHFFQGYSKVVFSACADGLDQVKSLKNTFDYCLADSEFNKQDLIAYGYQCPIDVLPIVIPFDDYLKNPGKKRSRRIPGTDSNVLFVGRVVPNKKHEDIIAAFALYQKYYDVRAKLYLVGSFNENDPYCRKLEAYVRQLDVRNVFFTGRIKFQDILKYYRLADVFLCMSEHEGFCVPLVEAMLFELPIVAYDACAVGDTMGKGGVLVQDKNLLEIAGLLDKVVRDQKLREDIIHNQRIRLQDLQYQTIEQQFMEYLQEFLGKQG